MLALMSGTSDESMERAARLRLARKRVFSTIAAAAESIGRKPGTVAHHENGTRKYHFDLAKHYGRRYGVPPEWLWNGPGFELPAMVAPPEPEPGDVRPADVPAPVLSELRNDVPVMGTAAAAAIGGFKISTTMVHVVPRPRGIMSARDIYALFVVGSSMEPAHPAGDLRYINPHRPYKPGDSVVVRTRTHEGADEVAYLGIFVSEDEAGVKLKKLNPPATVTHKREFVTAVHKVMTMNELMGV